MKKLLLMTLLSASALPIFARTSTANFLSLNDTTFVGADEDARMKKYISELRDFDISISAPEGFKSIDMRGRTTFRSYPSVTINCVGLENDSHDAVILWPLVFVFDNTSVLRLGHNIQGDLRAAHHDPGIDIAPLINIIAEKDMSAYSNADTVVIYSYDINDAPYLDRYEHMIGVYMRKYAHPALLFKIALTDNGLKDKDMYIKTLLDNISFGNKPNKDLVKGEKKTVGKNDLQFSTSYCRGGIRFSPLGAALLDNNVRDIGGEELLNKVWEIQREEKKCKSNVQLYESDNNDYSKRIIEPVGTGSQQ